MSIALRTKYLSIKKEKLSETGKTVLKSMYDATDGFKDAKATRKIKPKFEAFYDKLKKSKPEAIKGATKPKETPTAKQFKEARERRKSQTGVPKKESDIKKDADRPAIDRKGKRVTDGTHYPYKKGNVYYEYRDNRYDKRPAKYPKLEDGGYMAKGGKVRSQEEFNELVVEKQKLVKNLSPKEVAEMWNKNSNSPSKMTEDEAKMSNSKMYLADLLVEKELTEEEHNKYFEQGGMMANGGKTKDDKDITLHLYYHKTGGGAEYLGNVPVTGTKEASFESEYVVRIDGAKTHGGELKTPYKRNIKLYYHETSGGAEYLCSSKVKGTKDEGSFQSIYIVRIDGASKGHGELFIRDYQKHEDGGVMAYGGMTPGRWYKDNQGVEYKYIGEDMQGKSLFNDGERALYKSMEDFEPNVKENKMFGWFGDGGETHRNDGGDQLFADGGKTDNGNVEMVMSNTKAIEHHAQELKKLVDKGTPIEAWVVAKLERAETDLSDVTHYIDGLKSSKFADGGEVEGHDVEIFFSTKEEVADPYTVVIDGSVYSMSGTTGAYSVNLYVGEIDEFSPQAVKGWGKKINFVNADPELIKQIESRFEEEYAKGGKIENQYEGKTAEKVWEQWTEEQRSHFLLDHSELLDKDRLDNNLGYSRTIQKDKKYEDLTPHTKRVLGAHVEGGQYAKGGYMADGGMMAKGGGIKNWEDKMKGRKDIEFLRIERKEKLPNGDLMIYYKYNTLNEFDTTKVGTDVIKMADGGMMAKGGRLSRKQKQLDLNKNGKLDSQDFKMLRAKRKNARKK